MKKTASLLTFAVLLLAATPVRAQDRPDLDFVRAMREANLGDLALDFLDRLNTDKSVPADVKAIIPLEKARTRMYQAAHEYNSAKRQALYKAAATEFDNFIKARPKDPYAADARFESARIMALVGRGMLSKAQRSDEEAVKAAEYEKAHKQLLDAKFALRDALAELDKQLANSIPPAAEKALNLAKLACKLEMQIVLLDQGATLEPLNKANAREEQGANCKEAILELGKIFALDAKNPICWKAKAWTGKAFLDMDDSKNADKEFKEILDANGAQVAEAQRLARFFQFMDRVDPRKVKASDGDAIVKAGEEWVRRNPDHLRTPEGIILRMELAKTLQNMGKNAIKAPNAPLDKTTRDLLERAVALYSELDTIDTEFADEIQQSKMATVFLLAGNVDISNIKSLDTFDKAYTLMQAMAARLSRSEKPDERKQLLSKVLEVLTRATDLITPTTPEVRAAEVRGNLAWAYMVNGDPFKAVVLGEHLVQSMPHVPKAAAGGAYALQAYARMIGDPGADAKWIQTDTERMYRLALFMEKNWPNDVNTDAARHLVGTMLLRPPSPNPREAAAILGRISDAYKPASALTDACWWQADAARKMLSEPKLTEKEKLAYQRQVLKALETIPEVSNDAPAEVAQMYVQSRLQLGQTLFENKQYQQMLDKANVLKKRLPDFKNLDANYKKDLQKTVDALGYYAQYGLAQLELNAGHAVAARKIADPVLSMVTAQVDALRKDEAAVRKEYEAAENAVKTAVNAAAKEKKQAEAEDLKERFERLSRNVSRDAQLQRNLAVVALRAAILDDKGHARAQTLLKTLQAIAAEEEKAPEGNVGRPIYVQIVQEIYAQIKELKQGLPKTKPILDKTTQAFAGFLDDVAKQPNLTPQLIFFLASAYSRLEKHAEAGKLLAKIPAPAKDAPDKDQRNYRAAQLMSLQELRLAKQFDEALKMLNQIVKTEWGQKSTQVDEEKAALFEDWGKFGAAAVAWKELMGKLLPEVPKKPKVKEQYYNAYYNYIFCLYKYASTQDDQKKKQENLVRAAKAIVRLEETQPDFGGEGMKEKYLQLLEKEPTLKAEYQKAKASAAAAPAPPAANNAK